MTASWHMCPSPGCTYGCSPGHVLCRAHWLRLPKSKRRVLVEAFRNRETDPATFAAAVELTVELALQETR